MIDKILKEKTEIPYQIPQKAFAKQRDMILDKINDIDLETSKEIPYKIDGKYFNTLSQRVLRKIIREKNTSNAKRFRFIRKRVTVGVSIVSIFVIVFGFLWFFKSSENHASIPMYSASVASIVSPILSEDIEVVVHSTIEEIFDSDIQMTSTEEFCLGHRKCFDLNIKAVIEIVNNLTIEDIMCEHE